MLYDETIRAMREAPEYATADAEQRYRYERAVAGCCYSFAKFCRERDSRSCRSLEASLRRRGDRHLVRVLFLAALLDARSKADTAAA